MYLTDYEYLTRLPETMNSTALCKIIYELRNRLHQQKILAQTAAAAAKKKLGPILNAR